MCGFILAPADLVSSPSAALAAIRHRGADGSEGSIATESWFLGHSRLAVATEGLEGHQPFRDDEGRWLAFVGEIFDGPFTQDPGDQSKHPEFMDIEWAMNSPRLRGFHELDGFWSVARVNPDTGEATVVVDHLGIKPVYFWEEHRIFCSEIEPMFALAPRPPLDEIYLSNCIKFGYDYSGRTPYLGIRQLAPGTATTCHPHTLFSSPGVETFPYWDWSLVRRDRDLPQLIDEAIRVRVTQSKHPVGLLFSGGLDSSIIYYSLKRQGLLDDVSVFSIENGEAHHLPADPRIERLPAPEDPDLDEVLDYMQAPMDLGSAIPQVVLAKALREAECRTTLTGDGADELFGGYRRAKEYDSQASDVFCELPYYHLPRLDRVMMREGVEVRSPFLSPRVAAYALGLDYHFRRNKEALRTAFPDLPRSVREGIKVPLKSPQVLQGGVQYRKNLVDRFCEMKGAKT